MGNPAATGFRVRPVARIRFEDRLTKELAAGRLREARPKPEAAPPRRRLHLLRWIAAFSATFVASFFLAEFNQPPPWTALPGAGSGNLFVDGKATSVRSTGELTRRIRPGSRIRLESTDKLDLVSSGLLVVQLTPGTEMVLPSAPGRWFGRGARAEVEHGLVRVTTGRRFRGASLTIATPEAAVGVTGTTLTVIADAGSTRVCVLDGTARVGQPGGEMASVNAGTQWESRSDRTPARTGEMGVAERAKLLDLRDRMRAVMD